MRLHQRLVAGCLVVERKLTPSKTHLDHAAMTFDPAHRGRHGGQPQRRPARGLVGGQHRVARQRMQDVGEQQFLVLLFVIQPQGDDRLDGGPLAAAFLEQRDHRLVDMLAIRMHLVHRGPREQAALRARMARAERLVVRVEKVMKALVEG